MKKPLVALAAGAGVFALVAAGAATLSVSGTVPQSGSITAECQPSASPTPSVEVAPATDVTSTGVVTVTGFASECDGKDAYITFNNGTAASPAPIASGAATATPSATPIASVSSVNVVVAD